MTVDEPAEPPGAPSRRRDASLLSRAVVSVAVLVVALGLALVVAAVIGGDPPGPDPATAASPTTAADGLPPVPDENLRAAPALRIHPQRAPAGPPLELQVDGIGCPGSSGVLSVTEAGAVDGQDTGRLVVRRRFDVAVDRTFQVRPTLVGQPPGRYRVAITCDRYRSNEPSESPSVRDVFELTEVLELTGPMAAREITVSPSSAAAGVPAAFTVAGKGCDGADAAVTVRVFPTSAVDRGPEAVLTPAVRGGAWQVVHTIDAAGATGTYTVEASCAGADGPRFRYVSRHVHFGPLVLAPEPVTSTWEDLLDNLGIRLARSSPAAEESGSGDD